LQLKEELHRLPPDNRVTRFGAHHRALRDYIHSRDDPSAQSLLSVLAEHDALQFERVRDEMAQMLARMRAVEAREAEAWEAAQKQQRMRARCTASALTWRRRRWISRRTSRRCWTMML
jgi:hypothetical protein